MRKQLLEDFDVRCGMEQEALKGLWRLCFADDTEEFIDYYLRERVNNSRIFVEYCGDRLCAMAFATDKEIVVSEAGGESVWTWFVSGVAVHPDFRRRGLATKLMKQMENEARTEGVKFLMLSPAVVELYERLGFSPVSCRKNVTLTRNACAAFSCPGKRCFDKPQIKQINEIYNEFMGKRIFFEKRNEKIFACLLKEYSLSGAFSAFNGDSYAFGWETGEGAVLNEFAYTNGDSAKALVQNLLEKYDCVKIPLPVDDELFVGSGQCAEDLEILNMVKILSSDPKGDPIDCIFDNNVFSNAYSFEQY